MKSASIKTFLVGNPGAIFIVVFATLVFTCAYLLILNSPIVDSVALLAYCFLAIGVVLQALGFIREKALGERV